MAAVDTVGLEVKDIYRHVANDPNEDYCFELGGCSPSGSATPADGLDRVLAGAIESFVGVGYFFDMGGLGPFWRFHGRSLPARDKEGGQ
ncbi:MAG: hypothetical protein AB1425_06570 [Actinomycetota bacterium]